MDEQTSLDLTLTGDSMITRHALINDDPDSQELLALIRDADVAFTNLEALVNDFRGHPALESGGTHMAANAWVVDDLVKAGFDLFATATNHSLDYSIEGLLAMIEILERKGVAFAGVGRTLAESRMPAYVERPGGTVALISATSSFTKGALAAEQRPDMQGRPGVNPLRHDTVYDVTPEQLAMLRQIANQLGTEQQRLERIQLGFGFPPDDESIFPFLDINFREAEKSAIHTTPNQKDIEAIAKWVREARNRADVVIVSLHAHEQGATKEDPAEFIPPFARQMIDAGADMVVGHGPHMLRGMEIYRGKPIFYSLGNFIAQNDLVYKMPADAYARFRVDPNLTPSEIANARSQGGTKGFPSDLRYWQSLVPLVSIDQGRLSRIELAPITLGQKQRPYRRGRPRLARGEEARAILERFARLSAPFGTELTIGDERAEVRLPE